ncbi:MAG: hypothetical protein D3X82_17150 [Candidatus Leucobacter sulfamidivorax]|nr:hypothetical protein [Candidatus Leucobacter sulfamidivorax]
MIAPTGRPPRSGGGTGRGCGPGATGGRGDCEYGVPGGGGPYDGCCGCCGCCGCGCGCGSCGSDMAPSYERPSATRPIGPARSRRIDG